MRSNKHPLGVASVGRVVQTNTDTGIIEIVPIYEDGTDANDHEGAHVVYHDTKLIEDLRFMLATFMMAKMVSGEVVEKINDRLKEYESLFDVST